MISLFFMLGLMTACNKSVKKAPSVEFETTNSPCLDSMVVNQNAAGCLKTSQVELPGSIHKVECVMYREVSDPANPWLIFEFYIVPHYTKQLQSLPARRQLVCNDVHMSIWAAQQFGGGSEKKEKKRRQRKK